MSNTPTPCFRPYTQPWQRLPPYGEPVQCHAGSCGDPAEFVLHLRESAYADSDGLDHKANPKFCRAHTLELRDSLYDIAARAPELLAPARARTMTSALDE